jgi:hypothetical protein
MSARHSRVALATVLSTRCSEPGVRPGRAGNFWRSLRLSLTRQRKVTKRGALNAIRTRAGSGARVARSGPAPRCEPLRSRLPLVTSTICRTFRPVNAGCTPISSRNAEQPRRPSDAVWGCFGEPGVQPRVERAAVAMSRPHDKSCARAQRFASCRNGSGRFRAPLLASWSSSAVRGLFFGDFLLAPQKKVTRPPGRTPGNAAINSTLRKSTRQA